MREQLARQGMNPVGGPPERLGNYIKEDLARWKRVVTENRAHAGIECRRSGGASQRRLPVRQRHPSRMRCSSSLARRELLARPCSVFSQPCGSRTSW